MPNSYILTLVLTLLLCFPPIAHAIDWPQDAGNAQRTGYTSEEPTAPWTWWYAFNGPDTNGGASAHAYQAPKEGRTIVVGSKLYIPAGSLGLYAIDLSSKSQLFRFNTTAVLGTPAYDNFTQTLILGGSDGIVYKLNSQTGMILGTYTTGSSINKAILVNNGLGYVVNSSGELHKINLNTMTKVWSYAAGAAAHTPPALSLQSDTIVFGTSDLYIHAVTIGSGLRRWRVKPTPNSPGDPTESVTKTVANSLLGTQLDMGWPVISEVNHLVLIRYQLPHQALYDGPNGGRFDTTNAANRQYLVSTPSRKNLFALNLTDGTEKFIPAVGYGSTEDWLGTKPYGVIGTIPVIKQLNDGSEVAYLPFRNGQSPPDRDYRWSGHLGEMVLNDTTIPGLVAGDMRFVAAESTYWHIIDEETPLTVAGNTIFSSHWSALTTHIIKNRTNSVGNTITNPIQTDRGNFLIRALSSQCPGSAISNTTHITTCTNLNYVTDGGRYYSWVNSNSINKNFFTYYNTADPPGWNYVSGNTAGTSYSAGFLPRYAYVANGYVIVEGNGGDIMVFKHSGVTPPTPLFGDVNQDSVIDIRDIFTLIPFFNQNNTSMNLKGDTTINIFDLNSLYGLL